VGENGVMSGKKSRVRGGGNRAARGGYRKIDPWGGKDLERGREVTLMGGSDLEGGKGC